MSALLMREGAIDFSTGDTIHLTTFFDEAVDVHHIVPRAWCAEHRIDPVQADCIVNKTVLSSRTNRIIGGNQPSVHLERLQRKFSISAERMDEILESHLISPVALRRDDFDAFFQARWNALVRMAESVIGKAIRTVHDEDH